MNTLSVRQAILSDLDALAFLFDNYRQFYGKVSDLGAARSFLLDRFNHGESVLFIAENNATAIGFVQMYPSFSSVSMRNTADKGLPNGLLIRQQAMQKLWGPYA